MAIIYQHPLYSQPSGYTQCLILQRGESVLYPFNLDWNELRIGIFYTICDTGVSGTFSSETLNSLGTPKNGFYFGLKSNDSNFPYSNGCNFLGFAPQITNSRQKLNFALYGIQTGILDPEQENDMPGSLIALNNTNLRKTATNTAQYADCDYYQMTSTGDTFAPIFFGLQFVKSQSGNSNYTTFSSYARTRVSFLPNNDPSLPRLRKFIGFSTSDCEKIQSSGVFWCEGLVSGGSNLEPLNSIFLYWPFYNNNIRIHGIVAEAY